MELHSLIRKTLKSRPRHAHKGDFGHVLVIGGGRGMSGAPRLAALGALRVGAGLVTVATHPSHTKTMNLDRPEMMCEGVKTARDLSQLLKRATVLVIGPGLGRTRWSHSLFDRAMKTPLPKIIDADALYYLSLKKNKSLCEACVLTPHPGEAARLLKTSIRIIQQDRNKTAKAIQKKYGGICVLKGVGTMVTDGRKIWACQAGNPGMASGGMGDLLSGIIAGLVAQNVSLFEAAKLGVWLHAKAGDRVAKKQGERGMLASDLLPYLLSGKNK